MCSGGDSQPVSKGEASGAVVLSWIEAFYLLYVHVFGPDSSPFEELRAALWTGRGRRRGIAYVHLFWPMKPVQDDSISDGRT